MPRRRPSLPRQEAYTTSLDLRVRPKSPAPGQDGPREDDGGSCSSPGGGGGGDGGASGLDAPYRRRSSPTHRWRIAYTASTSQKYRDGGDGDSYGDSYGDSDGDGAGATDAKGGSPRPLVAPIIRRRHRIGRPFLTGSPLMWNEEYLNSPVTTQDEVEDDGVSILDDHDHDHDLGLAAPLPDLSAPAAGAEGVDDAKLWNQSNELRRRWRGGGPGEAAGDGGADSKKECSGPAVMEQPLQDDPQAKAKSADAAGIMSFSAFRINYLVVHIAIMLADGLQGTHLYVLYEGYGYSVASLYSLGFVSGAITSPFIGPLVDKLGRKRAAMLYCSLEMFINWLEQFPYFYGLIVSRVIGGVTTNLLFSVFESWLVTEHRRRGYAEKKLETILRDSVILSNIAAIASGFLAELLAVRLGPVGPFEGAVVCTAIALVLVTTMWRENYGSDVPGGVVSMRGYMKGAFKTIVRDTNISRIGVIQGLTEGSLQTFVFLWSPALARFAPSAPPTALGLDGNHEPAYGHIFGAFMACGVAGGLAEPYVRRAATYLVRDHDRRSGLVRGDTIIVEGEGEVKPAAVEFMTTGVYMACTCLLLVPFLVPADGEYSFSVSLGAFLLYEFMVGLYMPCEGVIRSIYMPTSSVCSVMTMLRVIVNIAVAVGVISTNYVTFRMAFAAVSSLMLISSAVQLSMVDGREWKNFVRRVSVTSVVSVEEDAVTELPSALELTRKLSLQSSVEAPSCTSSQSSNSLSISPDSVRA